MRREVRALLNEKRAAGDYQVYWDGKDNQGNEAGMGGGICVFFKWDDMLKAGRFCS